MYSVIYLFVCSAIHLPIPLSRTAFLTGIIKHTTSPLVIVPNIALWILAWLNFIKTRTLYTIFTWWYQYGTSSFSESIFFKFYYKFYNETICQNIPLGLPSCESFSNSDGQFDGTHGLHSLHGPT